MSTGGFRISTHHLTKLSLNDSDSEISEHESSFNYNKNDFDNQKRTYFESFKFLSNDKKSQKKISMLK